MFPLSAPISVDARRKAAGELGFHIQLPDLAPHESSPPPQRSAASSDFPHGLKILNRILSRRPRRGRGFGWSLSWQAALWLLAVALTSFSGLALLVGLNDDDVAISQPIDIEAHLAEAPRAEAPEIRAPRDTPARPAISVAPVRSAATDSSAQSAANGSPVRSAMYQTRGEPRARGAWLDGAILVDDPSDPP